MCPAKGPRNLLPGQFHATAASKSGAFTECTTMLPALVFLPLVYMHDALGQFEFDGHLVREQDHECRVGLPLSLRVSMEVHRSSQPKLAHVDYLREIDVSKCV